MSITIYRIKETNLLLLPVLKMVRWIQLVEWYERFQASAAMQMRSALFGVVTQHVVVIPCWRFGTTYWSHFLGLRNPKRKLSFRISEPLKTRPISCPYVTAKYYHYTLRKNPEDWSEVQEFHFYAVTRNNLWRKMISSLHYEQRHILCGQKNPLF